MKLSKRDVTIIGRFFFPKRSCVTCEMWEKELSYICNDCYDDKSKYVPTDEFVAEMNEALEEK